MGYVPANGFAELVKLILWDGAGSRASLDGNVGLEIPASRYQDGVRLEVGDGYILLGLSSFSERNQLGMTLLHCKVNVHWWNV